MRETPYRCSARSARTPGYAQRRQFEPEVILLAVGWYLRFSLSYREVEELLAERGLRVDHVTVWQQNAAAAKRFLAKALGGANHPAPRVINTDGHAAYPPAVAQLKAEGAFAEIAGIGRCHI